MNRVFRARACALAIVALVAIATSACETWGDFRNDQSRTGNQNVSDALSDPSRVGRLHVVWKFHPAGAIGFTASPMVPFNGNVYIGNGDGVFYAVDASTGAEKWHYPARGALTSRFTCNPSSYGIASSATMTFIGLTPVVIFAAPDQSIGTGLGEGRLFALNANNGNEVWKSPVLAHITGLTFGSVTEKHEQIGYSSPLIYGSEVYVGIGNHCDNPIQWGRVVAVNLADGSIDGSFSFADGLRPGNASPPGGDVWGSVAEGGGALYVTTGNQNDGNAEPSPSRGLSMLRLDATSGAVAWQKQPVPYALDGDPDWSATPSYAQTSCGNLILSTEKDGWTWAMRDSGAPAWVFPSDNPSWINGFTPKDGTVHGDSRYIRPGAAWGDVYVTMDGGEDTMSNVSQGEHRLHALNVCAPDSSRVRWMLDVPDASAFGDPSLGPPTITNGMVFVGTDQGHLIVIADPSISKVPPSRYRCTKDGISNANCAASGFQVVPEPNVLANIALDGAIVGEPAIARHNVYVATGAGSLYMLDP
ncbi:MAG TPA: PQQ-binding-like beta-propeller repeat protein [Candidatus Eremiobacteraceae bacterium]|nr:PQQ-binding-like beta-propeller repeat protein [Candidatus Eremiobacteraceae bacterium]